MPVALLTLLHGCIGAPLHASESIALFPAAADGTFLLWGCPMNSPSPRVTLQGALLQDHFRIDAAAAAAAPKPPVAIWENVGEVPRAVESVGVGADVACNASANCSVAFGDPVAEGATFFADTEGSIFMLEPGVRINTLVPRTPGTTVEHSVLSLAHDSARRRLYLTVNTTIAYLPVTPDGR